MTEAEAKTKWCPFARVPDMAGTASLTATNRHAGKKIGRNGKPRILRSSSMCIANQCMAWRWGKGINGEPYTNGHCGLAGTP